MYHQTIRKEINEKKKNQIKEDKTTKKILFKTKKKKCQSNSEVHQL